MTQRPLKREVSNARRDLLSLAREEMQFLLRSYREGMSQQEFESWRRRTAEAIAARTEKDDDISHVGARAMCPLCAEGWVSWPNAVGFALPGGLLRHLLGAGNTTPCVVTKQAFAAARRALEPGFSAADERAARAEAERRSAEPAFVVQPGGEPQPLSDRLVVRHPRDTLELGAADARLAEMGFTKETDGNVVTFRLKMEWVEVLADPRRNGRLDFVAWRAASGKQARFYIPDTWPTPRAKLQARLERLAFAGAI
jgi:hypothetical protein